MSVRLNPVNLTGANVGTLGAIDLTVATGAGGVPQNLPGTPKPTVRLHNESGAALACTMTSGQSFDLPAGGWQDCYPTPGDIAINFVVLAVLSNPQISLLMATYYYPGDPIPQITTLGNSPIGVSGTVSTNLSTATLLQNDSTTLGSKTLAEATVVGDPASSVNLTTGGQLSLGNSARGGLISLAGPGNNITTAQMFFGLGSISKIAAFGAYQPSTTPTAFNHNLGVVPDLILLQVVIGSALGYAAYNDSTMTTTQVTLVANAANVFVRGLAIKF